MTAYEFIANMVYDFLPERKDGNMILPAYLDDLCVDIPVDESGNISKEETGIMVRVRVNPYKR